MPKKNNIFNIFFFMECLTIILSCVGILMYYIAEISNKDDMGKINKNDFKYFIAYGVCNIIVSIVLIYYILLIIINDIAIDYKIKVPILLIIISNIFNIVILIYTQNNKTILSVSHKDRKITVISLLVLTCIFLTISSLTIYNKLEKNGFVK